jgi:glycosyltransferase involved in cell wall biosynthesis
VLFFDVTKSRAARHRSGLVRVSERLLAELSALTPVTPVRWHAGGWMRAGAGGDIRGTGGGSGGGALGGIAGALARIFCFGGAGTGGGRVALSEGDTLLTPELFSEEERPGFGEFLRTRKCRAAAIFHDAIPLKMPEWCRSKSVARHAGYMRLLAGFDRVLAISQDARRDLLGFWQWAGVTTGGAFAGNVPVSPPPVVDVVTWGADFSGAPRVTDTAAPLAPPSLLCVGIVEPRKNHAFLLDVCAALWDSGLRFTLTVTGRVNTETGTAAAAKLRAFAGRYAGLLRHLPATGDAALADLYANTRAVVFPTLAEGFGLPLIEALWAGAPCVCSDLPVLREQSAAGGCLLVPPNDFVAWSTVLREILSDDASVLRLRSVARTRPLPTWRETAAHVLALLP